MGAIAFVIGFLVASSAWADIIGTASVIDGDTIEIHGQRIRFQGIDAPESGQSCKADGVEWRWIWPTCPQGSRRIWPNGGGETWKSASGCW